MRADVGRSVLARDRSRHYDNGMDIEKLSSGPCTISRGLALVGDTWSILILRDAGRGVTQFRQFQSSLGIAPNILSRRLKAMTKGGVLKRVRYSEHPPRDEYILTASGCDFLPIIAAIGEWGREHNSDTPHKDTGDSATGARDHRLASDTNCSESHGNG